MVIGVVGAGMARYRHIDTSPRFLAVDLERQLLPGTFEYALNYLLDHRLDLSRFDAAIATTRPVPGPFRRRCCSRSFCSPTARVSSAVVASSALVAKHVNVHCLVGG